MVPKVVVVPKSRQWNLSFVKCDLLRMYISMICVKYLVALMKLKHFLIFSCKSVPLFSACIWKAHDYDELASQTCFFFEARGSKMTTAGWPSGWVAEDCLLPHLLPLFCIH